MVEIRPATAQTGRKGQIVERALKVHNRRHFGRPAASLTQLDNPAMKGQLPDGWKHEVVDVAKDGEEETSSMILRWMADKPNAVLIDSVHIKGSGKERVDEETGLIEEGDTDHVLVIGDTALIIDSKKWKAGKDDQHIVNYLQNDRGEVQRYGKVFPGGRVHIAAALHMWYKYLSPYDDNLTLFGAINIVSDNIKVFRYKAWYDIRAKQFWGLYEKSRFIEYLDDWYGKMPSDQKEFISSDLITQIAICCCRPYDRTAEIINTKPLEKYAM